MGKYNNVDNSYSARIHLTISKSLLQRVDEAAEKDYTNRSDLIRQSIIWYLRPQGREYDLTDSDELFDTLSKKKAQANLRLMLKDPEIDVYDT